MTAAWPPSGCGGQHGLDLAGLDPEAADLDLVVARPRNSSAPSGASAPGRRCGTSGCARRAERVGDEPFGGQAGPAQVAAGQPAPAMYSSPGTPGRHRLQPAIEHVDLGVANGRPIGGPGVVLAGGELIAAHTLTPWAHRR